MIYNTNDYMKNTIKMPKIISGDELRFMADNFLYLSNEQSEAICTKYIHRK